MFALRVNEDRFRDLSIRFLCPQEFGFRFFLINDILHLLTRDSGTNDSCWIDFSNFWKRL